MREHLEKSFRLTKLTYSPPGANQRHRLTVGLRYLGETADQVFDFAATLGKAELVARPEALPGEGEAPTLLGRLSEAKLVPQKSGEEQRADLRLVCDSEGVKALLATTDFLVHGLAEGVVERRWRLAPSQESLPYGRADEDPAA